MRSIAQVVGLLAFVVSCSGSTDLTVPPPPRVDPSFRVDIPPPRADGRLPQGVQPRRYRLSLNIDPQAQRFRGEVVIDVVLAEPAGAVVLHGSDLEVSRAEILVGDRRVRAEATFRKAAGATREAEELVLVAASEIPRGDAKLHLEYTAPLGETLRGIYRVREGERAYVFTQLEPSDARRVFPCFDDPIHKVPYELDVTVPKGNLVLSNTPEQGRSDSPDGKSVAFAFQPSKPMPSYLVALAIGPLEVREGPRDPVPLRLVATEGKSKLGEVALAAAAEQLAILSDYFARPYPYEKLDLVAVPNFGPGAMENAGLITFREELLLLDPAAASAKARRDVAMILAHELAHQWFGNLVTMQWWDDLWLNEGFATYMETLLVDRWKPSMGAGLEMLTMSGWVMDIDALDSARAVRQPVSNTYEAEGAFDGITYVKGASVLRMLHRWVGDDAFRDGVRAYLSKHAWGNATAADLFRALESTSKKDVAAVASTFLDQAGVPLVRATVACERGQKPVVKLAQQRYRARPGEGAGDPLWKIPVCVAFGDGGGKPGRACTLMSGKSASLELATDRCPGWLLPNADHEGYYRYAMPEPELDALARATRKQGASAKVGYLANLWALVQAGVVPAPTLLDTLLEHKNDPDRQVVEQVIAILQQASDALVEPTSRERFQRYASAVLLPTAKRLGWDARPGDAEDDRLLRRSVLSALATLTEDPWMVGQAQKRAQAYLDNKGKLDPDTAAIALRIAARRGDRGVGFESLSAALQKASTPARRIALVQALGSLGNAGDLRRALALIDGGTIRMQDALYVMRAAVEWPDSRAIFIEWLQDHLPELAERYPGFGVARMMAPLRRICEPRAREAASRTFEPLVREIGGLDRKLAEALESAALCIDLRSRQAARVSTFLDGGRF